MSIMGWWFAVCGYRLAVCGSRFRPYSLVFSRSGGAKPETLPRAANGQRPTGNRKLPTANPSTFLVSRRLILVYWRNSIRHTARKPGAGTQPPTANCQLPTVNPHAAIEHIKQAGTQLISEQHVLQKLPQNRAHRGELA